MTNPGTITHNEIMELYQKHVDPDVKWNNFTLQEQDNVLQCKRSNCQMDSKLLKELCPEIKEVKSAVADAFQKMAGVH